MGQPGGWTSNALVLIGIGVGVVFAAGLGIASFLRLSTTTLHPNTTDVPSVALTAPAAPWAAAVERARKHSRSALVDQNLPGLSVAVGVDGEIVWAEGFGWANVEKRIPVSPRCDSGSGMPPRR